MYHIFTYFHIAIVTLAAIAFQRWIFMTFCSFVICVQNVHPPHFWQSWKAVWRRQKENTLHNRESQSPSMRGPHLCVWLSSRGKSGSSREYWETWHLWDSRKLQFYFERLFPMTQILRIVIFDTPKSNRQWMCDRMKPSWLGLVGTNYGRYIEMHGEKEVHLALTPIVCHMKRETYLAFQIKS